MIKERKLPLTNHTTHTVQAVVCSNATIYLYVFLKSGHLWSCEKLSEAKAINGSCTTPIILLLIVIILISGLQWMLDRDPNLTDILNIITDSMKLL